MNDGPSDDHPRDESLEPESSRTRTFDGPVEASSMPDGRRIAIPEQIGPYRLLRRIAEGGMGVVFEAEQTEPVKRRVALKLIKAGMDTEAVVARFEAERQALAIMNHPCIAHVYDAGATEQGWPYFVMELVKGIPVDEYCDRHSLSIARRLELFIEICNGVQHAHQKGLIHRDLKPSNILVTVVDDRPLPKIIDFGIAKATALPLTEKMLFTETGHLVGTPEFMSPEQADPTDVDIDTRTDVYALGVILYRLLAGALPFDPRDLRSAGYDAIRRKIREQIPVKPSTRVSTLEGEQSARIVAAHGMSTGLLTRELRGDLDWITMKALEKDRARRYRSAIEFADDVLRHLRNEPVIASPPSLAYRSLKFVRRHRVGVAFAALFVILLLAGVVGTSIGMLRARHAEERAVREAEISRRISDFLVELFNDPDPREGGDVSAREILDRGVAKIRGEFGDEPYLRSRLLESMGDTYLGLGMYETSEELLQETLALRRSELGPDHPELAQALSSLAGLYVKRLRPEEALPLLQEALEIEQAAPDPDDLAISRTLNTLAGAKLRSRDPQAARADWERALELRERALGPTNPALATVLTSLGLACAVLQDDECAIESFQRSIRILEDAGNPDHPGLASALNNLAGLYRRRGDHDGALSAAMRAVAIHEKALDSDHPDLASSLNTLGSIYLERDQAAKALEPLERAHVIRLAKLPAGARPTLRTERLLVRVYLAIGTPQRAIDLMQTRINWIEETRGTEDPMLVSPLLYLAESLAATGRGDEADALAARADRIEKLRDEKP